MSDATDNRFYLEKISQAKADDLVEKLRAGFFLREESAAEIERLRAQLAAAEEKERVLLYSEKHWKDRAQTAEVQLSSARKALEECLGHMGWRNYTDEEMQHEAELGNGMAPIILRAREVIRSLHSNGE